MWTMLDLVSDFNLRDAYFIVVCILRSRTLSGKELSAPITWGDCQTLEIYCNVVLATFPSTWLFALSCWAADVVFIPFNTTTVITFSSTTILLDDVDLAQYMLDTNTHYTWANMTTEDNLEEWDRIYGEIALALPIAEYYNYTSFSEDEENIWLTIDRGLPIHQQTEIFVEHIRQQREERPRNTPMGEDRVIPGNNRDTRITETPSSNSISNVNLVGVIRNVSKLPNVLEEVPTAHAVVLEGDNATSNSSQKEEQLHCMRASSYGDDELKKVEPSVLHEARNSTANTELEGWNLLARMLQENAASQQETNQALLLMLQSQNARLDKVQKKKGNKGEKTLIEPILPVDSIVEFTVVLAEDVTIHPDRTSERFPFRLIYHDEHGTLNVPASILDEFNIILDVTHLPIGSRLIEINRRGPNLPVLVCGFLKTLKPKSLAMGTQLGSFTCNLESFYSWAVPQKRILHNVPRVASTPPRSTPSVHSTPNRPHTSNQRGIPRNLFHRGDGGGDGDDDDDGKSSSSEESEGADETDDDDVRSSVPSWGNLNPTRLSNTYPHREEGRVASTYAYGKPNSEKSAGFKHKDYLTKHVGNVGDPITTNCKANFSIADMLRFISIDALATLSPEINTLDNLGQIMPDIVWMRCDSDLKQILSSSWAKLRVLPWDPTITPMWDTNDPPNPEDRGIAFRQGSFQEGFLEALKRLHPLNSHHIRTALSSYDGDIKNIGDLHSFMRYVCQIDSWLPTASKLPVDGALSFRSLMVGALHPQVLQYIHMARMCSADTITVTGFLDSNLPPTFKELFNVVTHVLTAMPSTPVVEEKPSKATSHKAGHVLPGLATSPDEYLSREISKRLDPLSKQIEDLGKNMANLLDAQFSTKRIQVQGTMHTPLTPGTIGPFHERTVRPMEVNQATPSQQDSRNMDLPLISFATGQAAVSNATTNSNAPAAASTTTNDGVTPGSTASTTHAPRDRWVSNPPKPGYATRSRSASPSAGTPVANGNLGTCYAFAKGGTDRSKGGCERGNTCKFLHVEQSPTTNTRNNYAKVLLLQDAFGVNDADELSECLSSLNDEHTGEQISM